VAQLKAATISFTIGFMWKLSDGEMLTRPPASSIARETIGPTAAIVVRAKPCRSVSSPPRRRLRQCALRRLRLARPHDCKSDNVHAVDIARSREPRRQAGTGKRRLADAARPDDEQKGAAGLYAARAHTTKACKGPVRCRGSEKGPINLWRDDYLAGLRGFELPDDDLNKHHSNAEERSYNISGLHANSAGISVRWTKRHVEVRILSPQPSSPASAM
jgi:hypothetical protein